MSNIASSISAVALRSGADVGVRELSDLGAVERFTDFGKLMSRRTGQS